MATYFWADYQFLFFSNSINLTSNIALSWHQLLESLLGNLGSGPSSACECLGHFRVRLISQSYIIKNIHDSLLTTHVIFYDDGRWISYNVFYTKRS